MANTPPTPRIIAPTTGIRRVMYQDGDTADIMRVVMYADKRSGELMLPAAARDLRGRTDYDTCRNIFNFIRQNVKYQADRPGNEIVRSPAYLLKTGRGDCKSYSVAIMALLRANGIPAVYRFVSYEPGDFRHVYVVATLPGSDRQVILDAVHGIFDEEVRYRRRRDVAPGESIGAQVMSGIGGLFDDGSLILILLVVAWLGFASPIDAKVKRKKKNKKNKTANPQP